MRQESTAPFKRSRHSIEHLLLACLSVVSGCGQNGQSTLHPAGPAAVRIADLWWLMLVAGTAVFLLVVWVLVRAFTHRKPRAELHTSGHDEGPTRMIIAGGIVLPALMLTPLFLISLKIFAGLAPPSQQNVMEVEVTGRQWWWDVKYSDGLRTANEIHVPVGMPVRVRLRSDNVIHSFWAPSLHGKMDLVPGQVNTTWIQADSVGVYRGWCAEYCGLQHARMQFRVVAHAPADFAEWQRRSSQTAVAPTDSVALKGQALFLGAGCALCHTIRGTPARGAVGPDLTHLASRMTLAAGTLPNTTGHLAGWVGNPQAIKPGAQMPVLPLQPEQLHALVAYLRGLR
jgi:cytochrome c oxidase subunit II